MSYIVVLFENQSGGMPDAEDAAEYAKETGSSYPVTADVDRAIFGAMPTFPSIPMKCVLSPRMRILECYSEHDDELGMAAIADHAGGS